MKVKPFTLLANTLGQDEFSGVYNKKIEAADYIQNLHVSSVNEWSTVDNGYTTLGSVFESGAKFDALAWYRDASAVDYLIGAVNGKLKNINILTGAITSEISTAYTAGNIPDFETFKGTLFIADKAVTPKKWTGSGSVSSAGGFPLVNGSETYDKPDLVETYYNRLVYGNFNGATLYPSHIALSDDLAPETFTLTTASATYGTVSQVRPGDGQTLKAMKTINLAATNEQVLLLFKERSVFTFQGNSPATYELTPIKTNAGALGKRAVVQVGDDILFIDQNDIHSLTTASNSGDFLVSAIGSERIKNTLADLNTSAPDAVWTMHLPKRKEVWFAIPTGSNTSANKILVCYYSTDAKGNRVYAWSVRTALTQTAATAVDTKFFTGSSTGYLNKWFADSLYNSVGYTWLYEYPYISFKAPTRTKRVKELFAVFKQQSDHTISVTATWLLGGNSTTKTTSVTIATGGGARLWDDTVWDSGNWGGSEQVAKVKIPVLGNGELVKFTISGTSNSSGITFLGLTGVVEYGSESRKYR